MSHRVLLVGGSAVERGRLESSLRNVGQSAVQAETPATAALLCRQFGPSVVVLLEDPTTSTGRQRVALLLNQPATATTPLVALNPAIANTAATTLLRSLAALLPPVQSGADLVAQLDQHFGTDQRDARRRIAFLRRGPTTLRRIGDFLRGRGATGTITILDGANGAGGFLRLERGRIVDARHGALLRGDAIAALLQSHDEQPWGITFDETAPDSAGPRPLGRIAVGPPRPPPPIAAAAVAPPVPTPGPLPVTIADGRALPASIIANGLATRLASPEVAPKPTTMTEAPPHTASTSGVASAMTPATIAELFDDGPTSPGTRAPSDTASVSFPSEAPITLELGPLPARVGHERPSMRLLLLDDDEALLRLYEKTFTHAGHTVHTAGDGEAGIEEARRWRPDVIVSDIDMPKKTGWDVLAAVRSDPKLAETPVVLFSCHGDFLHGLSRSDAGADDYVEKGLRASALVERVEKATAVRRRLLSWGDEPPPSFKERLSQVGLFSLMNALEHSGADGEVRIDDGWITVRLELAAGELIAAAAQEADGTVLTGVDAMAAAVEHLEADLEWWAGDDIQGRAPSRRLGGPLPSGRIGFDGRRSLGEQLLQAAFTVDERRREARDRALRGEGRLVFRGAAAQVYFLVADMASARIAHQFASGQTPKELLADGDEDPVVVESVIRDLLQKRVADLVV